MNRLKARFNSIKLWTNTFTGADKPRRIRPIGPLPARREKSESEAARPRRENSSLTDWKKQLPPMYRSRWDGVDYD